MKRNRTMSKAEEFIKAKTRIGSNTTKGWRRNGVSIPSYSLPWLTPDQARKAVEIAREDELEYVKYQLDLRLPETLDYNGVQVNREDFINDFIKAMTEV